MYIIVDDEGHRGISQSIEQGKYTLIEITEVFVVVS